MFDSMLVHSEHSLDRNSLSGSNRTASNGFLNRSSVGNRRSSVTMVHRSSVILAGSMRRRDLEDLVQRRAGNVKPLSGLQQKVRSVFVLLYCATGLLFLLFVHDPDACIMYV